MSKLNRPKPGTITVSEVRIQICSECGCVLDMDLCDPNCGLDSDHRKPKDSFVAIYERTDKFLRDEGGHDA